MKARYLPGIFMLTAIIASIASCVKYPPLEFKENKQERRFDSITLALNELIIADSIEKTVLWMQVMGTRFALADNHRDVAVKVRNKFRSVGYVDARLDSFRITKTWNSVDYFVWQYNVVAELRGSIYPDSVIIIGAHYDAIVSPGDPFLFTPGANDNAGGTAAMIEIARVMKKSNYYPLASIQFVAFGAEEIGLMGSYNYASKISLWGREVKLMINNDMIAYTSSPEAYLWQVNMISYENSADVLTKSKRLCSRYTLLSHINNSTYYNRSDSYPFFLKGYKCIFFMSNSLYTPYHTTDDMAVYCNFDFCAEMTKLSCSLIVWSDTPYNP